MNSASAETSGKSPNNKKGLTLRVDYRLIIFLLLAVIGLMLVMWKPWKTTRGNDDTVNVTGTAKVRAEPDRFVFYPMYEFKSADRAVALKQVGDKSKEIVAGLKNVGVAEKDIQNNSSGYDYYSYPEDKNGEDMVYQLNLTVMVDNLELAQKVEDYLVTTNPAGQVTPLGQFSDEKRKLLEDEAREKASQDAKIKAEKSAKLLGYKLDRVKSVQDGTGFEGGPIPYDGRAVSLMDSSASSITLQPGQEEVYYSVTVTYYVK